MTTPFRVVHYVNQFFGGIGAEDRAGVGPAVREGPVGPGVRLQQLIAPEGQIVATALCGDNYFADQPDTATAELLDLIRPHQPELVILGPAFNAGRYGIACARLGAAVARELGVPVLSGMHAENPGLAMTEGRVLVVQTEADARAMGAALERIAALARAVRASELPAPAEGGYFPRGVRLNVRAEQSAAERAVAMLVRKLRGEPFTTELAPPGAERVPPAAPLPTLAGATIALVTDGGLIVRGNPEGMAPALAERYCVVDVGEQDELDPTRQEVYHRGYDTALVNVDPNRLVPLDAARALAAEGRIGRLLPYIFATAGCSAPVANARRVGQAIAEELRAQGVDGVILTST